MRALHCYRTYFPDSQGGGEEAIRQIALATGSLGVENTIFALSTSPSPVTVERPEGAVVRSRSWMAPASCDLGGPDAFATFRRLASASDVVHYHFPWPFADMLHTAVRPLAPTSLTYHSDIVRQRFLGALYEPLKRKMLGSMRAIVATSPAYAESSPVLSSPSIRDKVHVIPLGIDETTYPMQGDDAILQRLGLSAGEPFFLFIGVLRYYKGLTFLVQAARSVNAKIVVVGSGPEGNPLRKQAGELGAGNVIFAGRVSDVEKVALLQKCTALVLPSHLRSEAFGMVLVEASMFGRPMISCEIGTGTSFVNLHGETGIVVPKEDAPALASAMRDMLADDASTRRMGVAARKRYELLFSGPSLGRAYSDLYRQITA